MPAADRPGGPVRDTRAELREVARGGAVTLAGNVASSLLGFVLVVVISRGLHAGGAGMFFEAVALFTILTSVAALGADTGLLRIIPWYRASDRVADLRRTLVVALGPVLVIASLLAATAFLLAPQLVGVFMRGARPDEGAAFIRALLPFLPLAAVSAVALAATRGFSTVLPFVAVEHIGKPLARPLLVLVAIGVGLGSTAVALTWAAPVAVGFVVALWLLLQRLGRAERRDRLQRSQERPGGRAARSPRTFGALAADFWRFSAPRGTAAIFQITIVWLDVLLVGSLRSTREAGIYAAASRFITAGTFALQAVRLVIAPQFSAMLARREHRRAEAVHQVATWWVMAASWPLYLALAAFAPLLLGVFGREYLAGRTALTILALAMLVNLGTGNVQSVLLMAGRSSWNLLNMAVSVGANVVLNLLLIPRFGIAGAALAWAVSIWIDNLASVVEVRLLLGIRPFGRWYGWVALAALGCYGLGGAAVRLLLGTSPPAFTLFLVVATGVYTAMLWRWREPLQLSVLADAVRRRAGPGRGGAAMSWTVGPPPGLAEERGGEGVGTATGLKRAAR
jgi:O-antigen/teichoic acid export membrane protein